MNLTRTFALATLVLCPIGCKEQPASAAGAPAQQQATKPAEPAAVQAEPQDDKKVAEEIFSTRCTPCHGAKGAGDGAASATLTPKPANFTNAEWQQKTSDEHIEKIVLYGGAAVGKSPAMPANPDLDPKPGVVKALRAHIRSLKQ